MISTHPCIYLAHRCVSEASDSGLGCAGLWASDVIGVILWVAGFVLECSADFSKYAFKQNPANKGRFVNIGERPAHECSFCALLRRWQQPLCCCLALSNGKVRMHSLRATA